MKPERNPNRSRTDNDRARTDPEQIPDEARADPERTPVLLNLLRTSSRRVYKGWRDTKAISIPRRRDAELNELPKQTFMLLPLLLLLLFLLYVLYHVLNTLGCEAQPCN